MKVIKSSFILMAIAACMFSCSAPEKKVEKKEVTFQYAPKKPVDGKYLGIVELGGDGFNSFIINADSTNLWFLEKAEYGVSNAYDNNASSDEIKTGLESYIEKMLAYNVGGKDIHFVMSSTARKNERVMLISALLDSIGYVVNSVDADEEGKYALIAALPEKFYDNGFVVDIGSGNTKLAWTENGEIRTTSTYGAKYYKEGLSDKNVAEDVFSKLKMIPKNKKKHCFIIGGVPYQLAKPYIKDGSRYAVLKAPDTYQIGEDQKFNGGLNIYRTIYNDIDTEVIAFDTEANFSIGFLLSVDEQVVEESE
ncbi:MAG: hypothetical protein AAFQ94_12180 [Bacteroidota bacterium]